LKNIFWPAVTAVVRLYCFGGEIVSVTSYVGGRSSI